MIKARRRVLISLSLATLILALSPFMPLFSLKTTINGENCLKIVTLFNLIVTKCSVLIAPTDNGSLLSQMTDLLQMSGSSQLVVWSYVYITIVLLLVLYCIYRLIDTYVFCNTNLDKLSRIKLTRERNRNIVRCAHCTLTFIYYLLVLHVVLAFVFVGCISDFVSSSNLRNRVDSSFFVLAFLPILFVVPLNIVVVKTFRNNNIVEYT